MDIRLGFIGNSKILKNCPTNKTVSVASLNKEDDEIKKINRLKKVALSNIQNTMKILKNNRVLGISVYGLNPKLFPLANYPDLEYFRYIDDLKEELLELGNYIKKEKIRINIHLENTIIINSLSDKVFNDAIKDIKYQNTLLNYMGMDNKSKIVVNVGGAYMNKGDAIERFYSAINNIDEPLRKRLVLKNDDESIPINSLINVCKKFAIPFFLNLDDKNANSENVSKSIESWRREDIPALFGLKTNSGLVKLNKISGVDVVFGNAEKEYNILKFNGQNS